MPTASARIVGPAGLDAVIATDKLNVRTVRRADTQFETTSLLRLKNDLAHEPATFFQILVETALNLSKADSTGISLLNREKNCFVWPAVAGPLSRFIGDGTPADFGPCATVLERNTSLLMIHPERHFDYLGAITPPLEEVLLVPFYIGKKAVGTIWAVSHTKGREFDIEDKRLLESLSTFAASAYEMFERIGVLEPLLRPKQS
jgi:hypothetical protein